MVSPNCVAFVAAATRDSPQQTQQGRRVRPRPAHPSATTCRPAPRRLRDRSTSADSRSRRRRGWPAASPRCPCAPAVRDRDGAGHDVGGQRDWKRDLAVRRTHRTVSPSPILRCSSVVDVHERAVDPVAAHQQRRVVHPRVLRARLAHADHPHRVVRGLAAPRQGGDLGRNVVVIQPNSAVADRPPPRPAHQSGGAARPRHRVDAARSAGETSGRRDAARTDSRPSDIRIMPSTNGRGVKPPTEHAREFPASPITAKPVCACPSALSARR